MITRLDLRGTLGASGQPQQQQPPLAQLRLVLPQRASPGILLVEDVRTMVREVRHEGDVALRRLTERLDGVAVEEFRVPQSQLDAALHDLDPLLREALEQAHVAAIAFHRAQRPNDRRFERDGMVVRELLRPVERVGCHVPGGLAQCPSSVLAAVVPARVAGVESVALCVSPGTGTPGQSSPGQSTPGQSALDAGTVPALTLAAAALCGVDEVYRVGGAQAIAALAYGTESIPAVDVVVATGDEHVAVALREVAGVVGVLSASTGPAEIVIVADETAPSEYVAIDLVAQAEDCSTGGLAWLITTSEKVADEAEQTIGKLVAGSPHQARIEATLHSGGALVLVDNLNDAMEVANAIAPQHLHVITADPEALVPLARNAGTVLCGVHTPATVSDYLAGPSNLLPTNGSARFAGGLTVNDFLRIQPVISLDEATLARVVPHAAAIATAEGHHVHARSVQMRTRH